MTDAPFELARDYYADFTSLSSEYQAAAARDGSSGPRSGRDSALSVNMGRGNRRSGATGAPPGTRPRDSVRGPTSTARHPVRLDRAPPSGWIVARWYFLGMDWEAEGAGPLAYQTVIGAAPAGDGRRCCRSGGCNPRWLPTIPRRCASFPASTNRRRRAGRAMTAAAPFGELSPAAGAAGDVRGSPTARASAHWHAEYRHGHGRRE